MTQQATLFRSWICFLPCGWGTICAGGYLEQASLASPDDHSSVGHSGKLQFVLIKRKCSCHRMPSDCIFWEGHSDDSRTGGDGSPSTNASIPFGWLFVPLGKPSTFTQWIKATAKDHLSGQVSFNPLESTVYHQSWANVIFQKLRWKPLNIKLTILQYTMRWPSHCHFGHHENVFTFQVTALQNTLPGSRHFDLDGLFKFTQTLNPHSSFYKWITRFRESCARSCSQWQNQHLNPHLRGFYYTSCCLSTWFRHLAAVWVTG